MAKAKVATLIREYEQLNGIYDEFCFKLKNILEDLLIVEGCRHLAIEARSKDKESLKKKLEVARGKYAQIQDVHDLAAARIITYVGSDIDEIESVITNSFLAEKIEVEERLGTDKVGYRSHHWLISLPESRLSLPEYKKFKGLRAELQIRTVLAHAWAQIGHDQLYKPDVLLPEKIKRDFTLLSGLLEIADNEFERISEEIANYTKEINEKTRKGDLSIPIDSVSLRSYFEQKFGALKSVEPKFGPDDGIAEVIIGELEAMNISSIKQLDEIVPSHFAEMVDKFGQEGNFAGLARSIMIIHDCEKYFKSAWKNSWSGTEGAGLYDHYGVNVRPFVDVISEME
jgi:putative GTP pyrophosphokinase